LSFKIEKCIGFDKFKVEKCIALFMVKDSVMGDLILNSKGGLDYVPITQTIYLGSGQRSP
jgi:hypothetical protein